jgi:hypothetical protein
MRSVIINTGVQDNNHINEWGHIAINALSTTLNILNENTQVNTEDLRAQIIYRFNVLYDSADTQFSNNIENHALKNNNVETELSGHTLLDQADL